MNIRYHLRAWAFLVLAFTPWKVQAQDQNYNEDWVALAEVPPAVRSSAEKAVTGARFEAVYHGRDLAYRFVGTKPDRKTVAVKVAEDGRLISVRTWTPMALSRVPNAALSALQTEVSNNLQITGFRATKATAVELYRAEKHATETFFELFGTRSDLVPARAEVTAEGDVRRAEIILKHPIVADRKQKIATSSIPPAARQKILEASPGSTFTRGIYIVDRSERTAITAVGLDKTERAVEVMIEIKAEPKAKVSHQILSIATAINTSEVPPEVQAKLREAMAEYGALKGFQATEAQRDFTPWAVAESSTSYILSGKNAKGKRMGVNIHPNRPVEIWEDEDAAEADKAPASVAGDGAEADRKFTVLTARFGIDDRWVDLTKQIQAKVADGRLNWKPIDLPDPAYGTNKVLAIVYSADGQVGLHVSRADGPFVLPPPKNDKLSRAEVPSKGFAVLSAQYGFDKNWSDVTEALRGRVQSDRLEVANPSTDPLTPAKEVNTTLTVAYSINGEVGLRTGRADRPLELPEGRPTTGAPIECWKAEVPAPTAARAVGFSGDGKLIFLGGEDGVVRCLDAANGRELGRLEDTGEGRVDALAVSASGAILVARPGRPVRLWPSRTSKQPISLGDYKEPVTTLAISPRGDQAATGSWDKSARLWDLKTGRQVRQFLGNKAVVMGVGFAADGRRLVTTSWDGTARLWDTTTGAQKFQYEGDNGQLGSTCVSQDGKVALIVSDRGSLITWDLATGKLLTRVVAPVCAAWAIALSPDRRWVVDAEQNTAVLRDAKTLEVVARLERHIAQVKVLAFSPDSRSLLTGADDKVVRLWKLPEPTH